MEELGHLAQQEMQQILGLEALSVLAVLVVQVHNRQLNLNILTLI